MAGVKVLKACLSFAEILVDAQTEVRATGLATECCSTNSVPRSETHSRTLLTLDRVRGEPYLRRG